MSVVDTDLGFWIGYVVETAYRSGSGSTKFDETALTGTMTTIDRCTSCLIKPASPEREEVFDLGSGLFPNTIETIGYGPGELVLTCMVQTDDFYDLAIAVTKGSIPTTWAFHLDNGIVEFDLFGCRLKEWKGEAKTRTITMQTITFEYAGVGDGGTLTPVAYDTGAISTPTSVSATIDSKTTSVLIAHTITETITNTAVEGEDAEGLGQAGINIPAILKQEIAVEIGYKNRDSNPWGAFNVAPSTADEMNETPQYVNAAIVWHTTLTSSITNVIIDTTNSGDRESSGLVKHVAAFKQGAGCTIA